MNNKDIDIDIERELPKAILKWYIFRKTDSVVYIGYPTDPYMNVCKKIPVLEK